MKSTRETFFSIFVSAIVCVCLLSVSPISAYAGFALKPPYIPESLVVLSSGYAVVVDKQAQKLYVFRKSDSIVKIFEAPCSTGKKGGAKQEQGDARTPNGIFFVHRFYKGDDLTPIYGPMAFHLDFPNVIDRRYGRNGTNIWIHGTNKPLQPFQSNGCIALRNQDVEQLAGYIFLNKTPVIIEESIKWIPQNEKSPDRSDLERIMYAWDRAVTLGDVKTLSDLYLDDSRETGVQQPLFKRTQHLRSLAPHLQTYPRDVTILKEGNTAVILFDKIVSVFNDTSFQGEYIRLFLEKKNNHWVIVNDVKPPDAPLLVARAKPVRKETVEQKTPPPLTVAKVTPPAVVPVQKAIPAAVQPPVEKKAMPAPQAQQVLPPKPTPTAAPSKPPETTVAAQPAQSTPKTNGLKSRSSSDKAIVQVVEKWAASWQAGNMAEYRSCFSPEFKSRGMGLGKYIDYKAALARRYKKISVHVSNIKVDYTGDRDAEVTFTQKYSAAGGPKTTGVKTLELRLVKDTWKIHREVMSR